MEEETEAAMAVARAAGSWAGGSEEAAAALREAVAGRPAGMGVEELERIALAHHELGPTLQGDAAAEAAEVRKTLQTTSAVGRDGALDLRRDGLGDRRGRRVADRRGLDLQRE